MFLLLPVCVLVFIYVYWCVVTCFPVCVHNLIVNIRGPQMMTAYIFLGFIFLEIRKKEFFWIFSLERITSTKNNHKPAKGSLSSSQVFFTSLYIIYGPLLQRSQSQQGAAEVLQPVVGKLKDLSVAASDMISDTIKINVSCEYHQWICFSAKQEKLDILAIPLSPHIYSSLSKFSKTEILEPENKWFCPSSNCL